MSTIRLLALCWRSEQMFWYRYVRDLKENLLAMLKYIPLQSQHEGPEMLTQLVELRLESSLGGLTKERSYFNNILLPWRRNHTN